MNEIRITSVRNAHGAKVKRCCASCQHKCVDGEGKRICAQMMLKVQQKFKCKQWQMSDGLQNAGKSVGKIKRKEYLAFLLEIRSAESDDIQRGIITKQERKTLEQIRQLFTEKYGNIYVIE